MPRTLTNPEGEQAGLVALNLWQDMLPVAHYILFMKRVSGLGAIAHTLACRVTHTKFWK